MMTTRIGFLCAAAMALPMVASAKYYGGGKASTDCYAALDRVTVSSGTKLICDDGDSSCDADGVVDGKCSFAIDVCVHNDDLAGCVSPDITDVTVSLAPKSVTWDVEPGKPAVPATAQVCGTTGSLVIPIRTNKKGKKLPSKPVKILVKSTPSEKPKVDRLTLVCKPGAATCPANSAGGPNELRFIIRESGNDLDTGWTGDSHNQLNVYGSAYRVCVDSCPADGSAPCTENLDATNAANGDDFGPPLPLLTGTTATCVRNKYDTAKGKITGGTANLQTGEISATVNLISQVYLTTPAAVCPECSAKTLGGVGRCSNDSRSPGATCKTEGLVKIGAKEYALSTACLPVGNPVGELEIPLSPLTTATSSKVADTPGATPCGGNRHNKCGPNGQSDGSCTTTGSNCAASPKGGFSAFCCDNNTNQPCFPTEPGNSVGRIDTTGTPDVPADVSGATSGFPKESTPVLASAFCIAATNSDLVNFVAGLPGPGQTTMPVQVCWLTATADPALCPAP